MANRLQAALQEGLVDEVNRLVASVLDDESASFEVKAGAVLAGVPSWLLAGDLETEIERCEAGSAITTGTSNAFPVGDLLHFGSAAARLYLGEIDAAEEMFVSRRRDAAASESDVQLRFVYSQGLARVRMLRGCASDAVRYLREAVAMIEKSPELIAWNLGLLAQAWALTGNAERAEQVLDEALAMARRGLLLPDQGRARALIAYVRGERSRAVEVSLAAANGAMEQGQRLPALFCAHDAARWGAGNAAVARARAAADCIPGVLAPALVAHAAAAAANDAGALVDAAAVLERLGAFGYAAEAYTLAAAYFAEDGLAARATREGERAHALAVRVGMSIEAVAVLQGVSFLTTREREVAAMAGRGRSDKDIADALGVSVRTVETHLHRVYAKLGVGGRIRLAEALGLLENDSRT